MLDTFGGVNDTFRRFEIKAGASKRRQPAYCFVGHNLSVVYVCDARRRAIPYVSAIIYTLTDTLPVQ